MNEKDRIRRLNTDIELLMKEGMPIGATNPEDEPLLEIAQALAESDLSEEGRPLASIRQHLTDMAMDIEQGQTGHRPSYLQRRAWSRYGEHSEKKETIHRPSLFSTFSMGIVTLAVLVFVGLVFVLPQIEDRETSAPTIEATTEAEPSVVAPPATSSPTAEPAAPDLFIYDDAFGEGWEDWSWHEDTIVIDYANSAPVHGGASSIAVTYTGGWSGLQIGYHGENLDASDYDTLRFWIHGGTTGGQVIILQVGDKIEQPITPQANVWTKIDVPLLTLGWPRTIYNIAWFNNTDGSQGVFYIDDIVLVNTGLPTPTLLSPGPGPTLSVDEDAGRYPISP